MDFTETDVRALCAIYEREGVLADYQFGRLMFDSVAYGQRRASKLFHNGYIWLPSLKQRAQLPYNVYYLDEKGIAEVAKKKQLPMVQLHWRRLGARFSRVLHDVELNDERIAITQDIEKTPGLQLVEWIPEYVFGLKPDVVACQDSNGQTYKKYPGPNGGFVVTRAEDARPYRFFRERERTFKSSSHFVYHKVRPALTYITSAVYKARFGDNGGRWLVSVSSVRRIRNILTALEQLKIPHADWLYFTPHIDLAQPQVMTRPIWYRAGKSSPFALFA
jgi:hypothetical protein